MNLPAAPQAGFYAILDTGYITDSEWEYQADTVLAAGASLMQIRAMGDPPERVRELVERILPIAQSHKVPLILNDRLDLAASIPGVGLHMGQADGSIKKAREVLGAERILGLSTHTIEQARAAMKATETLSYFTVGPIFRSQTHSEYKAVGPGLIKEVKALAPPIPFFCNGGINKKNLSEIIAAGASGVMAASYSLGDPDLAATVRHFSDQLSR